MRHYRGRGIALQTPDSWTEITDELEPGSPLTLAHPGIDSGVLQFSPALYQRGTIPNPSAADLLSMVEEFGRRQGLGVARESLVETGVLSVAAATFHDESDRHVRVWFVSDGINVLLVTYVGSPRGWIEDLIDCEAIVRSISFTAQQFHR